MAPGDGVGLTDRLLLSLIVHCAKDDDHSRAMAVLDSAFTCEYPSLARHYSPRKLTIFSAICEAEYELPCIPATACLTVCSSCRSFNICRLNAQLLWQYGDKHYNAKRWTEAAEWFSVGSHKLFRTNSPASAWAKCYRKAALCYIEHREFAKASAVVRRCPVNEAATHYIVFLTAVHQGEIHSMSKIGHHAHSLD